MIAHLLSSLSFESIHFHVEDQALYPRVVPPLTTPGLPPPPVKDLSSNFISFET